MSDTPLSAWLSKFVLIVEQIGGLVVYLKVGVEMWDWPVHPIREEVGGKNHLSSAYPPFLVSVL